MMMALSPAVLSAFSPIRAVMLLRSVSQKGFSERLVTSVTELFPELEPEPEPEPELVPPLLPPAIADCPV